jgi:hypothetical protein
MSMRNELLKATEDLRRAEGDKLQLEGDIATLKQQVMGAQTWLEGLLQHR